MPLARDHRGMVRVPLHALLDAVALAPLLEATALTLLHPQACTRPTGATVLMVPLGEALAVLPFRRHFPDARALVTQIEAVRMATAPHPTSSTRA